MSLVFKFCFLFAGTLLFLLFQNFTPSDQLQHYAVDEIETCEASPAIAPTPAPPVTSCIGCPIVGANYNKSPETIDYILLRRAEVKWIRGSINMLPYIRSMNEATTTLQEEQQKIARAHFEEQFQSLERAQSRGYKVILTLRWHFADDSRFTDGGEKIPERGSVRERKYFNAALGVVSRVGLNSAIIVVGNEPTMETREDEIIGTEENMANREGNTPMVDFYDRLARTIHQNIRPVKFGEIDLLVGSLNRIHMCEYKNKSYGLLKLANDKPYIDGIDVHAHVANMEAFKMQFEFARQVMPLKKIISTEFSLVRAFFRRMETSICVSGEREAQFCEKYGLPMTGYTTQMFLNDTLTKSASEKYTIEKWTDFFKSRSYLPDDFFSEAYKIFEDYNVFVATYGISNSDPRYSSSEFGTLGSENSENIDGATDIAKENSLIRYDDFIKEPLGVELPWTMNALFVPATVRTNKVIRTNGYFFPSFMKLRKQ